MDRYLHYKLKIRAKYRRGMRFLSFISLLSLIIFLSAYSVFLFIDIGADGIMELIISGKLTSMIINAVRFLF